MDKAAVLARLDFRAFYARAITSLKINGKAEAIGLCPFHPDRDHPNLHVNLDRGTWKCFACNASGSVFDFVMQRDGVTYRQALESLGQHVGLTPDRQSVARQIVAEYNYTDEVGQRLYQVVRYAPKDFRQRRPDGRGGWIYNLAGVRRVVYLLPDLRGHHTVFVVEGEKDVDRLWPLGLPATCNPQGAGKWQDDYTRQLHAAGVSELVILPDQDPPGEAHAQMVARSGLLHGLTAKIVHLPNLP